VVLIVSSDEIRFFNVPVKCATLAECARKLRGPAGHGERDWTREDAHRTLFT
jgi:hypothetical protein